MPVIAQRYDPAVPIADLVEHPDNPRHGDEAAIDASMAAHGFYGAVLVQESSGRIIAGNHRTRVARARGEATVPVLYVDVDDDRARRILLVDNRTNDRAGYDRDELARLLADLATADDGLAGTGWDDTDLAALLAGIEAEGGAAPARLHDRYVVPPFSVLDGRAGYWRERKRAWMTWGVRSGDGRAERLVGGLWKFAEADKTARRLRADLGGGPSLPGAAAGVGAWAGTSIFDPVLAEVMIRWFCPPGGRIADPFSGGSVRGAVASALGHPYTGFDLRPEQIAANVEQGADLGLDPMPTWLLGDARRGTWDGRFDMLLTCPPYWHLEHYGDDPADLCNAPDEDAFADGLRACLRPAVDALADDSFAVVVLGPVRDHGRLVDLPGIGARVLADVGCVPYNDLAFLTPLASASLRAENTFRQRKAVPVHQRVLVAAKGDPVAAAARCGPVDVGADDAVMATWTEDDEVAT